MDRKKESHRSYSVSFKLKVVQFAEEKGKHQASKLFQVDRKRVREWCQNKDKLKVWSKSRKRAPGAGRPVRYADIEEKLLKWFSERRESGVRVTGKSLKLEALRLRKEGGSHSFKASCGWFTRFKRRHNISFRRTTHIAEISRDHQCVRGLFHSIHVTDYGRECDLKLGTAGVLADKNRRMNAQKVSVPKLDQANPGSFQEAQNPGPADPGPQCSSPSAGKSEKGVGTSSNGKEREDNLPAEVCVVIGGSRNTQTQGSYTCGVCGKKYKYYNCFQTHVRAHKETESGCKEGRSQNLSNSFRYTCDICGKKYKYYSCFQEHRDLHTVDDPYEQVVLPMDESKEEEQVEPFQKSGPKTGNYVCDFCGKQYKYFNPYQEHLALHAPIRRSGEMRSSRSKQHPLGNKEHETSKAEHIRKENVFCQKMEGKKQTKMPEANSSQNSSGTSSPKVPSSFSGAHKLYTCGSCGIQFQFYNNLLEHMQSHAADNKNHIKAEPITTRPSPTCVEMSVDKNHSAHGEHPPG